MKSADEFLKGLEAKPVNYYIYAYYDKGLGRFNQPVINNDEPGFVYESTVASIKKGKFPKEQCFDLLLVMLGTFDLKTGTFNLLDEPQILCDCAKYFIEVNADA